MNSIDESSGDEAEALGSEAFSSGLSYRNPFSLGSVEYNRYERGFFQALKKSDRKLVDGFSGFECATGDYWGGKGPWWLE